MSAIVLIVIAVVAFIIDYKRAVSQISNDKGNHGNNY